MRQSICSGELAALVWIYNIVKSYYDYLGLNSLSKLNSKHKLRIPELFVEILIFQYTSELFN